MLFAGVSISPEIVQAGAVKGLHAGLFRFLSPEAVDAPALRLLRLNRLDSIWQDRIRVFFTKFCPPN